MAERYQDIVIWEYMKSWGVNALGDIFGLDVGRQLLV